MHRDTPRRSVSLPSDDPDPRERAAELARAQQLHRYSWDRPEGLGAAAEVPASDGFPLDMVATVLRVQLSLGIHELGFRFEHRGEDGFVDLAAALALFEGKPEPPIVRLWQDEPEKHDEAFAWQRLAGSNPLELERIETLPVSFTLTEALFQRTHASTDSMRQALSEGRVYMGDWTRLDGVQAGHDRAGRPKQLCAPRALFLQQRAIDGGKLLPLAIQLHPVVDARVVTPADGPDWIYARMMVQLADANVQALEWHLGRCHFLMEAFAMATARQLADNHPLQRLLQHHFQYTLAINDLARTKLLVPGGQVELLLAPTLGASLDIVRDAVLSFDPRQALPPRDLSRRGVDDHELLPSYPWRDDALPLWSAITTFVREYLELYYDDARVAADPELAAWIDELRSRYGGRLERLTPIERLDELVELVGLVLFTAGPLHSVINYSQFDFMALVANTPMASYGAPHAPRGDDPVRGLLLPETMALLQFAFFYQQVQVRENRLGEYPAGQFDDPRVAGPLARFRSTLADVERVIVEREASRLLPFPWLRPSVIPASVHI